MMTDILAKLEGGDRPSIGRANEVVEDVLRDPTLFGAVFNGMLNDDPLIRMRAADAAEKIAVQHPDYLEPHKTVLIDRVAAIDQREVRWHVAQILPRLALNEGERRRVVEILFGYLEDRSRIVQVNAMQALADLAQDDEVLRQSVLEAVSVLTETGGASVRSRGRRLLEQLLSQRC